MLRNMATIPTIPGASSILLLCFLFAFALLLPFNHTTPLTAPNPKYPQFCNFAVYPYWSLWFHPAFYDYDGGRYNLGSTSLQLSPEWDETNSTYYVRLSDSGATYAFSHITRDLRPFVSPSHDDILIYNIDTGRYLSWRDEGGQSVLIESNDAERTVFQFSIAENLSLPCPRIFGACCLGYNIRLGLSETSGYGLGPYVEDGVTYFKLQSGDDNLFPFLLIDDSGSSASSHSHSRIMPVDHSLRTTNPAVPVSLLI